MPSTHHRSKNYQRTIELKLNGTPCVISVHYSVRRSLRLTVNARGEIEVRAPLRTPAKTLVAFLQQHEAWLLSRLDAMNALKNLATTEFRWLGQTYALVAQDIPDQRSSAMRLWRTQLNRDHCLSVPTSWSYEKRIEELERFRREQAKAYYQARIEHFFPAFAQYALTPNAPQPPTLRVKNMRTRWGSLSSRGYINLSLELSQYEPDLVDIVIIHELCHLKHMDHGSGFQALMDEHAPDWRERQARLQRQSQQSMTC